VDTHGSGSAQKDHHTRILWSECLSSREKQGRVPFHCIGRVLQDVQGPGNHKEPPTNAAFVSYPVTQFLFPRSTLSATNRSVEMTYDLLYRRINLTETATSGTIAHWEYFGPSRVVECQLQNGLTCTFLNNARTRSAIQPGQSTPGWGDGQT